MTHDNETLADICEEQGTDPQTTLAWNEKCRQFQGAALTLRSRLRHHTAVLLPGSKNSHLGVLG